MRHELQVPMLATIEDAQHVCIYTQTAVRDYVCIYTQTYELVPVIRSQTPYMIHTLRLMPHELQVSQKQKETTLQMLYMNGSQTPQTHESHPPLTSESRTPGVNTADARNSRRCSRRAVIFRPRPCHWYPPVCMHFFFTSLSLSFSLSPLC